MPIDINPFQFVRMDSVDSSLVPRGDAPRKRLYPSYTTAELKRFVQEGVTEMRTAEAIEKMKEEIAARESGESVHKSTPQVDWKDIKVKPLLINEFGPSGRRR